ncbi:Ltp family lipoprotein [Candidatus Woesebacteria bacterium]|nr:Ltp family lipoprotein [Candidatus Woesebacteria bacterium]MCD8507466.1 Ltp family lipoprotein [Candidatus Woesebacteria bacterium]MCD8526838.1 Ltp family lipoprotein [Candidatus Woesebacteria bacterium]MCD8545820.1 Ltp family lipoprotein [Candidatus Woesebacteria bacterium]
MKKLLKWGAIVLVVLFVIGAIAGSGDDTPRSETSAPAAKVMEKGDTKEAAEVEETSNETTAQKNAVRKANSYLSMTGFSRSGLIKQLEFEKFSTEDATYAVDKISPDWNEQAAKKAKSYQDLSGFSRDGLIKQLEFEGFTTEQAAYGADSVGL